MLSKPSTHREEYLKQKRAKKRQGYFIGVIAFVCTITLLSFISHRPQIRISGIEISGGVLVSQTDVEPVALDFLQGSYLWLFPKNNAFLYEKSKLEKLLTEKFPRIETINIGLKNFHTLLITITEHKPDAIWCDTLLQSTTTTFEALEPEHCYFMNANGLIFSEAPHFSGDAYFKYYGLVSTSTPIGQAYIASSTEFSNIVDFISSVRKLSVHPQYLVAEDNNEFILFLSGGSKIYFDTKTPFSLVAQNLSALLRTPPFATSTVGNLPVEYIDMRYGNKLFYKLK